MYEVTVTTIISASHRLQGYLGKCENLHGHNYKVEASVGTDRLDEVGLAVDFGVLREHLKRVVGKFDHSDLNQAEEFKQTNPSSENLARVIYAGLKSSLANLPVRILRVKVYETEGNHVTYHE